MGNVTGRSHNRSKGLSISSGNSRIVRWDGPGLPAPPGKPILIPGTEESHPDVVGIRWERSPSNGGSAIVGYLVEHRRLGSPHWLKSTPALCTFPELTLSGLEPGWRYQFRVRAQNALGFSQPSEISDPLTVTLQRTAASAPHFEQELQDTVAMENEHTEFVVRFSGTPLPKISWFKDGFEIFSSRRTRIITENGKSVLLIHQTVLNDEGEIKCTATNRAGHVSTKAKLSLEASPRIRLPRQYEDGLLFEQGETVRLKVSLAGKPPPTVTWYHDGEFIADDSRHVFESMDNESTLKIPEATREDRGEYIVKAVNQLGEDVSSFLVTVTGRPAAPGKATVAMTLGRSVTLSWKEPEDDGGCKIGTYIVEYYRIGWDVWLKAATSRQTNATLTELIEGSEYKFRVKAENPYGISDPSEESDVIFIPDLKRGITSPSLTGKSQSHREIHRSRAEKREVSFAEPPQRSRSLTREEAMSRDIDSERHFDPAERSASAQRLSMSGKPTRADSRVTFAPDTLILVEPTEAPIPPLRTKDHSKQNDYFGNHVNRSSSIEKTTSQDTIQSRDRPTSPTMIISPPMDEATRRTVFRESRSRSRSLSMTRERSLSPLTKIQEIRNEDSLAVPSLIPRTSVNLMIKKQDAVYDETIEPMTMRRSVLSDDRIGSPISPREDDENELRGSSEFMLVLYPEDEDQSQHSHEKIVIGDNENNGIKRITSEEAEDEEDLVAPPMSLSLPELFSADHQVIETLREAVSSTELLHERAMERFYRAVAAEEASEATKRRTQLERRIGELAISRHDDEISRNSKDIESELGALDARRSSLRRRLSNSGVTSQNLIASWQAKKNRRRSSEGQTEITHKMPTKLLSPLLPDVEARSDPNIPIEVETSIAEPWRRRSNDEEAVERLRRWHETNVPLVETLPEEDSTNWKRETVEDNLIPQETIGKNQQIIRKEFKDAAEEEEEEEESIESSEESSEEVSSADSEDLKLLKERILARQVMDEEDTYHPRGKPIPHIEPESPTIPINKTPLSPSTIVPKSILKKRTDDPVPLNSFGRPIPPEKPVRKIPPRPRDEHSPLPGQIVSPLDASETSKPPAMSESDTDSILNAAEAAKNRRIQAKMRSATPEDEKDEADVEARMAMVNHYTEIVREYAAHQPHKGSEEKKAPNAVSSRRSSISEDQRDQELRNQLSPDRTDGKNISRQSGRDVPKEIIAERQPKKNAVPSRGTTPARESKRDQKVNEQRSSRPASRNQSPASRSRNVSKERGGASSRSSSKTRVRAASQERTNRIPSRAPSEEKRSSREKSIERTGRRSKPSSRTSSRTSSRSSSRDRYRATTPVETKMERLQKALESKKYRSLIRASEMDGDYTGSLRRDYVNDERLAVEAERTVKTTVGYVIDVSLLLAAVYVYVFKKEIWAIPFIALLLYRRIQQEVFGHGLRGWWPFNRKK